MGSGGPINREGVRKVLAKDGIAFESTPAFLGFIGGKDYISVPAGKKEQIQQTLDRLQHGDHGRMVELAQFRWESKGGKDRLVIDGNLLGAATVIDNAPELKQMLSTKASPSKAAQSQQGASLQIEVPTGIPGRGNQLTR